MSKEMKLLKRSTELLCKIDPNELSLENQTRVAWSLNCHSQMARELLKRSAWNLAITVFWLVIVAVLFFSKGA